MLRQDQPDDFVVGTTITHSVRDLCEAAFACLDLDYRNFVFQEGRYYRPAEVDLLIANPSKAQHVLGWEPAVSFESLVSLMVQSDLERLTAGHGL